MEFSTCGIVSALKVLDFEAFKNLYFHTRAAQLMTASIYNLLVHVQALAKQSHAFLTSTGLPRE